MTKKFRAISFVTLIGIISSISLSCADGGSHMNPYPDDPGTNPSYLPITYEEIYHQELTKTELIGGELIFKASYGYVDNNIQGFNYFSYDAFNGADLIEMQFDDNKWSYQGAYMDLDKMKSTDTIEAVRRFNCPCAGNIHITGNPRLTSDSNNGGIVRVFHNGVLIGGEHHVDDTFGVYMDLNVSVLAGDNIRFYLAGNTEISFNPTLDYSNKQEDSLHYAPDGFLGDVHPFYDYDSKKMYMFYLSTEKQTETPVTQLYGSLLSVSSNMVNYVPTELKVDTKKPPESDLFFALGVFKDHQGNYRSCFGRADHAGASMSTDLVNWENGADMYFDEEDNFKYHWRCYFGSQALSGRDPDIYYDVKTNSYYCIVLTYQTADKADGEKSLIVYKANKYGAFEDSGYVVLHNTGHGDAECPQIKRINNRWYIFYSIFGTGTAGNVGKLAYRVGDENKELNEIDWDSKVEYYLDGGDLHAAQLTNVGDKLYAYGWINSKPNINIWGGYLNLPHEVYQAPDGTLYSRLDGYYTKLLKKGRLNSFNSVSNNTSLLTNSKRTIIEMDVQCSDDTRSVGAVLQQGSTNYYVVLQKLGGKTYARVSNSASLNTGVFIELRNNDADHHLKMVIDDSFVEFFVDDQYTLTAHTTLVKNGNINIKSHIDGGNTVISRGEIFKLADYTNVYD